jgi:hypothetical protein
MIQSGSGQMLPAELARQLGDIRFRDVVIFTTFCHSNTVEPQNTLPNQGLGRKIARNLSGFSTGGPPFPDLSASSVVQSKNQLQCSQT